MADLQIQRSNVPGGFTPTFQPCEAAGDMYVNQGREVIAFQNGDTVPHTVIVTCQTPCNLGGTTVHNIQIEVVPGTQRGEGPIPPNFYNDATGHTLLSYPNGTTGLQVAVFGAY